MKYIRTNDGVYETSLVSVCKLDGIMYMSNDEVCYVEILRQSDIVKALCDEFIVAYEDGYRITYSDLDWAKTKAKASLKFGHKSVIYGAIWAKGEHGEPILKSVAEMNEEEDLCLL